MTTPTPTKPPSPTLDAESQARLIHNVSLGALIVCPLIIALPPRKLDIYTFALLTGTFLGGNQLLYERTGRSIVMRWSEKMASMTPGDLPPKAKEVQERLRMEKAIRFEKNLRGGKDVGKMLGEDGSKILGEVQRMEEEQKKRGLVERVWMGNEGEDWKAKRDQREKEALEEGRGYGGLIMDQVWEVWNWGGKKMEEVKEKDEEVVAARKVEQGKNEHKK